MNINGVNWLTMQEVAEILHCSITNVSALNNTNKILFKKVDGLFRCTEKDLKVYNCILEIDKLKSGKLRLNDEEEN